MPQLPPARPPRFRTPPPPSETVGLRREVRHFLAEQAFEPRVDAWLGGWSPELSIALGERGWLGMTWPKGYGGHERTALERYAVIEELLAAGAPVAAHWIADRQSGPLLLRFGTEEQKQRFLPAIARGECYFAIGMSEPDSGSDLASVSTTATRVDGGWRLRGTKLWASGAHRAHFMVALVRTGKAEPNKHHGLSQLVVDLRDKGIEIRPIRLLTGEAHFNEVVFNDAFVPVGMLVGEEGDGWRQVTSELAYERSGPERILSTYQLYLELARAAAEPIAEAALGRLTARIWTLRRLSMGVAAALGAGEDPALEAALVKDLGTVTERQVAEEVRLAIPPPRPERLEDLLWHAIRHAPGFTLRGGTTEVLRTVVARGFK